MLLAVTSYPHTSVSTKKRLCSAAEEARCREHRDCTLQHGERGDDRLTPCHGMSTLPYSMYTLTAQAPPCATAPSPAHNNILSQNFWRPSIAGSAISSILPCSVNEKGARMYRSRTSAV